VKTNQSKKDKNKRKYEKLKEYTEKAKMEFHKRQGTYQRGMNLDDPLGPLLVEDDNDEMKPPAKKNRIQGFCEHCGKKGHVAMKSKKCTAIPGSSKMYRRIDGTVLTEAERVVQENTMIDAHNDSNDCENDDCMPLVAVPGEDGNFDVDTALNPTAALYDQFFNGTPDSDDDDSVQLVGGNL
jgi:hypothetical protein